MQKKTFFIVPGFKQETSSSQFAWLIKFLKQQNYEVVGVPITWNGKTNMGCADDFKDFYNQRRSEENYILGFSYGAVITLITANLLKPKKIYLCSLSPDFSEDLSRMKPWIKNFLGKKRIAEIKQRSGRKIAKELRIPSVIFYGEKESKQYPQLKIRCEETAKLAKHSRIVVVEDAPHNLGYPTYIEAIKKEIAEKDLKKIRVRWDAQVAQPLKGKKYSNAQAVLRGL